MKRKNKIKRFAPKFTGDYVKIGESCKDCEYSDEPTLTIARIRCTRHKPKVVFHRKYGWICYSFSEGIFLERCKILEECENNVK